MSAPQEPTDPSNLFSPFLPSTYNMPEDEDRVKTFLVDQFTTFSDVINDKKIGMYIQDTETLNGNKIFYDDPSITRNGYQYLARIKSYPANGNITVLPPPNIDPNFIVFQVFGSASKPPTAIGAGNGDFFSYYSQGNAKITFTMTDLAITITTIGLGAGYSGFIIIDYIRRGI